MCLCACRVLRPSIDAFASVAAVKKIWLYLPPNFPKRLPPRASDHHAREVSNR
jgi:hypothetical protein